MRQKWHSAQFFPIWHTSLILCHAAKLFNITGAGVKWYSVTHFLKHLILFSLHVSCPHKKTKTRKATGPKGWEHSTQGSRTLDPRVENTRPKGREHSTLTHRPKGREQWILPSFQIYLWPHVTSWPPEVDRFNLWLHGPLVPMVIKTD